MSNGKSFVFPKLKFKIKWLYIMNISAKKLIMYIYIYIYIVVYIMVNSSPILHLHVLNAVL